MAHRNVAEPGVREDLRALLPYATETQKQVVDAVEKAGSIRKAAELLGVGASNVTGPLKRLREKAASVDSGEPEFTALPKPDDELSYEELKAYRKRVFEKKHTAKRAEKWRGIKFKKAEPTAVVVFGDPHVDDDGCNWPQLEADTQTVINTPGMYGGSIGDNINNWIGRLTRLYANQSTTEAQAWRLAEGWIKELSDAKKMVFMVRGNHDMWSGAGDPLNWIMRGTLALDQAWQAQMQFEWPGCEPVKMWASHDFKGHSQFNPLHAQKKKHLWHGGQADIYIAGHRHHWALSEEEDEAGKLVHFARARGYKFIDEYAEVLGHGSQEYGASITYVFQPRTEGVNRIRPFPCVQEAADYLTFLRQRKAA